MNLLARFAPSDDLARLLLGISLVILGLILVAAVVSGVALRGRPAARHGLWLSTLVLVALSPAIVAISGRSGSGDGPSRSGSPGRSPGRPRRNRSPSRLARNEPGSSRSWVRRTWTSPSRSRSVAPSRTRSAPTRARNARPARSDAARTTAIRTTSRAWTRDDRAGLAVLIWLAGSAFGLARLGAGCLALRALRRTLRPLDREAHARSPGPGSRGPGRRGTAADLHLDGRRRAIRGRV